MYAILNKSHVYYVFNGADMNDKAEAAKEYLERLRHTYDYMRHLEEEAASIVPLSAYQTDDIKIFQGYTESGMIKAEKKLEKLEEVNRAVYKYLMLKHEILMQLEKLQNAQYEDVLYCRYVLFLNTRETARKMNLEETYTSRVHVKALEAFSKVYDKATSAD